jgi:hypothetical protein
MNINLHIERLVLDGLPLEQRQGPQLQAAVERELTRLLSGTSSTGAFVSSSSLATINAGAIHLAENASPLGLGKQIATALHGGIGERHD